jgi:hypothetical protein
MLFSLPQLVSGMARSPENHTTGGIGSANPALPPARMRADYRFLRTRCALGTRFEHDVERRLCRTPEAGKSTALDENLAETALASLGAQGGALPRQRYRYAD